MSSLHSTHVEQIVGDEFDCNSGGMQLKLFATDSGFVDRLDSEHTGPAELDAWCICIA